MRVIEKNMLKALNAGINWQSANTTVLSSGSVFLHGNRIAYMENGVLVPDLQTLAYWPTNTTRSRLQALGFIVKGSVILGRN